MSNKPLATTQTLSEPTAPKYEVPDSLEAWERFDRLVGKVLDAPKHISTTKDSQRAEANPRGESGSRAVGQE